MKRKENMPDWAYWGLWGINSRKVAMIFVILGVVLTLIAIPMAISSNDYKLILVVLAPIWYWLSIKWVDKNSSW